MTTITLEHAYELLGSSFELAVIESRDISLDNLSDLILKAFEDESTDSIYEITDIYEDDKKSSCDYFIFEELKPSLINEGYTEEDVDAFIDENILLLQDYIYERDKSDVLSGYLELLIPCRITLNSNYEGFAPNMKGEAFRATKKALKIKSCKTFTGKELVAKKAFDQECENLCNEVNRLTFMGVIKLGDVFNAQFDVKGKSVVIPKGATCGFFDSNVGGGSLMNMRLTEDLKVDLYAHDYDYYSLTPEIKGSRIDGYSLRETYGFADSDYEDSIFKLSE